MKVFVRVLSSFLGVTIGIILVSFDGNFFFFAGLTTLSSSILLLHDTVENALK